jgi:hypothetical protein
LLCVAGSSLVAYGYLFASSNTVQVNMQYKVDLSLVSVVDSAITLNAAVTYNGAPVRAGILVDFYISVDGGASTYFASSTTDAGGIAQTTYIATYNGKFDFQATVTVP